MEMIYAAMLLHSVKQQINEDNLKKVLHSVGANVEEAKIKGVVASLEGINIDDTIAKAAMPIAAASAPVAEKKEEKKEEDTAKTAESAAAGLGALFG